jgi:nitrogen regulatory protein PII
MTLSPKVLLVIIIERELENDARRALKSAGIETFTCLQASGEGIADKLNRWVDPEKIMLISVVLTREVDGAMEALKRDAQMGVPGVGVAFTLPVDRAIGIGIP